MIEKIEGVMPDLTQENIDRLLELFPDAATELLDENGNLVRGIDFDVLRSDLDRGGGALCGRSSRALPVHLAGQA